MERAGDLVERRAEREREREGKRGEEENRCLK